MPVRIGVPRERAGGERRVSISPEIAAKLVSLGAEVLVERGAGEGSFHGDEDYGCAVLVSGPAELYASADIVLAVRRPEAEDIRGMRPGTALVGHLRPYQGGPSLEEMLRNRITAFAVELIPRISRAQGMDALSSQAAISGYLCALIAAENCPKFFPMLTYAAGTIRPARVLVIGAGVAGLQAIATAKRLGAVVEAYDVRPSSKEEVESLGAKFVDAGLSAAGSGGYARELGEDEKARQAEALAAAIVRADALITTAAIPGRRAPLIVSEAMLAGMKRGAVVVDMAAESGGNVAGTVAGEKRVVGGVTLIGAIDLPSMMSVNASDMYSRNLYNFISPCIKEGKFTLDWKDQVLSSSCLCREGEIVNEAARKASEGGSA
ncbi:MAG: NAD(P) transhydrogenase subunit alpha [Rectinemataceae bacterium]|jgi:NAD(P) transhydrogenase subunit alpha